MGAVLFKTESTIGTRIVMNLRNGLTRVDWTCSTPLNIGEVLK